MQLAFAQALLNACRSPVRSRELTADSLHRLNPRLPQECLDALLLPPAVVFN